MQEKNLLDMDSLFSYGRQNGTEKRDIFGLEVRIRSVYKELHADRETGC